MGDIFKKNWKKITGVRAEPANDPGEITSFEELSNESVGGGSGLSSTVDASSSITLTNSDLGNIIWVSTNGAVINLPTPTVFGSVVLIGVPQGFSVIVDPGSNTISAGSTVGTTGKTWTLMSQSSYACIFVLIWGGALESDSKWTGTSWVGGSYAQEVLEYSTGDVMDITLGPDPVADVTMAVKGSAGTYFTVTLGDAGKTDGISGASEVVWLELTETGGSPASIDAITLGQISIDTLELSISNSLNLEASQTKTYWLGDNGNLYLRNTDGGAITSFEDAVAGGQA